MSILILATPYELALLKMSEGRIITQNDSLEYEALCSMHNKPNQGNNYFYLEGSSLMYGQVLVPTVSIAVFVPFDSLG